MEARSKGTCHLHGDNECGKVGKFGSDGQLYPGRIRCSRCFTVFCRNGLWRKFGEKVEGSFSHQWVCRICNETCCKHSNNCDVMVPPNVTHTHCHNFRSAYGQRMKRKRAKLMTESVTSVESDCTSSTTITTSNESIQKPSSMRESCKRASAFLRIYKNMKRDGIKQLNSALSFLSSTTFKKSLSDSFLTDILSTTSDRTFVETVSALVSWKDSTIQQDFTSSISSSDEYTKVHSEKMTNIRMGLSNFQNLSQTSSFSSKRLKMKFIIGALELLVFWTTIYFLGHIR